ncbi:MAG: hypothetical protein IRZ16_10240 [Myxococcaceae bacterium]|nr:hypothetical protein [Myxococcaceae bacterium]
MDNNTIVLVGGSAAALVVLALGMSWLVVKLYRKVDQGKALIINGVRDVKVTFNGGLVLPVIHRAEVMDISLKTIEIDRRGKEGLICQDNIRADIKVAFFVRVNKTEEDVLKVAQSIGCARASDPKTLEDLFVAKFSEALKTVGKRMDFEDLYKSRDHFKDQIVEVIGKDLNGYMLEDVAIDYLEQTPIELLDKDNILDSQGIRKITEMTAAQNILTNEFRQNERKAITKQNVEANEAVLALERQQAEAEAKQKREIETIRAREAAETERVKAEEHARAQLARIKAEEEILINDQNKLRQVEVAQKNRERIVGIESEKVAKDRQLEAIAREREVELQRIAKEKALEVERKAIADVVRTRIAVDKTVAQEEENIKDLRLIAEAKRQKEAAIVHAEAEAQELLVKEIKAAEASEEVTKIEARKKLQLADAEMEAADRLAKAKIRLAEGIQAEHSAKGLGEVRVKEADAVAIEKVGLAEARVIKERKLAEAAGDVEKGLAQVRVEQAEAEAIKLRGLAEAVAIQEKLVAEAKGIAEKAEAMKALDEASRAHEEYRLRLQKEKEVELASITARTQIASSQAQVMSEAMGNAKIHIVGGEGKFFDQFMRAVTLGQSADAAIDSSGALRTALKPYLEGDRSLPDDLKEILSRPGVAQDASHVALAALMAKMAAERGGPVAGESSNVEPRPTR